MPRYRARGAAMQNRLRIVPLSIVLAAFTAAGCVPLPYMAPEGDRDMIVPIDVALETDRTPPEQSSSVRPHVTLLQGFIRESNVHVLTANIANIIATSDLDRLTMNAAAGGNGAIDPSLELRRLQERVAEAFGAYQVDPREGGRSLIATASGTKITSDAMYALINYVPFETGVKFRPHVVAGGNQQTSTVVGFKANGAAVYQLDHLGHAGRTLWTWDGASGTR
jgi:hypothetical protein